MVSPSSPSSKKLTERERKYVKAKAEGKSNTEAAMVATGTTSVNSAKTLGHRLSTSVNVQQALEEVYAKKGLTLEKIIQPFADGLVANRVVSVEGDFFETEVPDHQVRMTAGKSLAQFIGVGKEIAVSGGVHFHQHTADKKAEYSD